MNFSMLHPADQIVMIMNRLYYYGMTTTTGGNLSIKDSDGVVWISPSGVDKGSLRRDDIMQIMPDGKIVGLHKPSSEYPFHLAIYKKRPDLKAVLHAPPPALVAFSIAREEPDTSIIPDADRLCGKVTTAPYALPGSTKLGENIAAEFEKGINTVMLENHGVVVGNKDLFSAFKQFETLDYCARVQINASVLGGRIHGLTKVNLDSFKTKTQPKMESFKKERYTSEELQIRRDMVDLIHRAYGNQLFTSSEGTFSCKLSDGSFIITPYDKDRKYLEEEDLVQVKDGKCEEGKTPSRSVLMHQKIYEKDDKIKSIIIAHPPHVMAFAVTDNEIDGRLIPESYIALKTVKKYSFGSTYIEPDMLANEITLKTPVAIVENDCIIAAGTNLLNAFDRLEVLEYSAKSLCQVAGLKKKLVRISDSEIKEIEVAFNL